MVESTAVRTWSKGWCFETGKYVSARQTVSGLNGERSVYSWLVGLANGVVFEVRGVMSTRDEHLRLPERGQERSC